VSKRAMAVVPAYDVIEQSPGRALVRIRAFYGDRWSSLAATAAIGVDARIEFVAAVDRRQWPLSRQQAFQEACAAVAQESFPRDRPVVLLFRAPHTGRDQSQVLVVTIVRDA
jgi:hypothetical protein